MRGLGFEYDGATKEYAMALNNYRDEAGEFLKAIGADGQQISKILSWLDEELAELKDAAAREGSVRH